MSETYSVLFRGDILPGHTLPDVKARMAQLFKLDEAKLAVVFSGKPVALKKGCDQATAEKLKAVLAKAGAEVEIRSSSPAPAAASKAAAAPTPSPSVAPAAAQPAPPPAPASASPPPESSPASAMAEGSLDLAPVGAEVISEAERAAQRAAPVEVDISGLSLKPNASSFALPDEEPAPGQVSATAGGYPVPDIEAPEFDVFEAGADLLKEDEKAVFEELALDLSGIDVAEVGADLLKEEEKVAPAPVAVSELSAELAPVGSDIGEAKKDAPPPPPKTDHLSLA
jgi:hypothetical protein